MTNELTYFAADGFWYAIDPPDPLGSSSVPRLLVASGMVDFIPRVPVGFSCYVDQLDLDGGTTIGDASVSIPTSTGRIWDGRLSSIYGEETPSVELLADTTILGLIDRKELVDSGGRLIYDVRFHDIVYSEQSQALSNFGFYAPTDASTIVLTGTTLERLPYGGPSQARNR